MGLKAFAGVADDAPPNLFVVRATDTPPSLFAGRATGPGVVSRGDKTLLDWWLTQARGFVDILEDWTDPDKDDSWYDEDEDVTLTPVGPDMTLLVIGHPPERKLSRVGLGSFRESTGRLTGEVVAGLSDKLIEPILGLRRAIDEAVAVIRAGGSPRMDAVRMAFQDAEVIHLAIKTAAARKRALALPSPALLAPTGPPAASGTEAPPVEDADLVTLSQAAGMVHRVKRSLEHYKTKGKLPAPVIEGGGGQPDLYDWKTIGPWLESTFGIKQPARFPASRRG